VFEKILVPLDGSVLAEQALPYVTELASAFGSEVTLIGVCEPEEIDQGEACRLSISNKAEEIGKMLAPSGSRVKTVVLEGKPASQITAYAEKNKIGLIALTSHGRSGLAPWSLGSTVQKILHLKSPIPLMLVKSQEVDAKCDGLFQRILLPLDSSTQGEVTIPFVVELARKFETEVTLCRIIEDGRHVHSIGGLQYVRFLDQDKNIAASKAEDYLSGVSARFTGTKAKLIHEVRQGDPAREILKIAEEQKKCLIAMASHGHSGIDVWTFGSVTYKIIQASSGPVLLVRAQ